MRSETSKRARAHASCYCAHILIADEENPEEPVESTNHSQRVCTFFPARIDDYLAARIEVIVIEVSHLCIESK